MEILNKSLTATDINIRLSFPTNTLQYLAGWEEGQNYCVNLKVKDSRQKVWNFSCRKRRNGSHPKPWLSGDWLNFVEHYGLMIGDKVVMVQEDDHFLGSQYIIEVKRNIIMLGKEICADRVMNGYVSHAH
ncbi:hypothetical protein Tsubulata_038957 [Turnera subulata]|uniref:TF-B3 domain-containing protein n=1 Tax=Turnera subulata TaxID=218843 RepID=A0A9Q0JF14_9ROSI|nr:hypothetical protein Tsubulata_038957 [Turnera subulata]